jgi:predicted Zn-dependent peptidase
MGFLNSLFGGKFTSRVNLNLRERLGITYGAFSRLTDRRSAGPFTVACAVSNQAVGLAATEILRELDRLRTEPVDPSELEETRSYLLGVLPYGLQTIEGLASRLRDIALFDLPLDQMERTIVEYRSLDAEQLLELARRQVHPERSLIVAAGPASELAAQLEPLGPLRVVKPDGRKGGE